MAGSRLGIGTFTVAMAVALAPLAVFATLLGFLAACFGDTDTAICHRDDPDRMYVAVSAVPVGLMLVVGGSAAYQRRWGLAFVGAGLAAGVIVAILVVAWFMAEG